jgi:hypothetical protein
MQLNKDNDSFENLKFIFVYRQCLKSGAHLYFFNFMEPIITVIAFVLFLIYGGLILYYRRSWVSIVDFRLPILDLKPITKIAVIIQLIIRLPLFPLLVFPI